MPTANTGGTTGGTGGTPQLPRSGAGDQWLLLTLVGLLALTLIGTGLGLMRRRA